MYSRSGAATADGICSAPGFCVLVVSLHLAPPFVSGCSFCALHSFPHYPPAPLPRCAVALAFVPGSRSSLTRPKGFGRVGSRHPASLDKPYDGGSGPERAPDVLRDMRAAERNAIDVLEGIARDRYFAICLWLFMDQRLS
ncbi:hypothetical protein C8R45DRAFT_1216682 [Mycena sanguinolenta]|nr:hypothetical protein C8R45DRAFT_1216682 [Mycena sanguinolenta]